MSSLLRRTLEALIGLALWSRLVRRVPLALRAALSHAGALAPALLRAGALALLVASLALPAVAAAEPIDASEEADDTKVQPEGDKDPRPLVEVPAPHAPHLRVVVTPARGHRLRDPAASFADRHRPVAWARGPPADA